MGELADRIRAISVSTIGPFVADGVKAARVAADVEALERRVADLTAINTHIEQENDLLRDVADEYAPVWREEYGDAFDVLNQWRSVNDVDGETRNHARNPMTGLRYEEVALDTRKRLMAAEKRAEQAEAQRCMALEALDAIAARHDSRAIAMTRVQSIQVNDVKPQYAESYVPNFAPGLTATFAMRGACDLVIVAYDTNTPPNPDLLERRGTELVEAGEQLLAEYAKRKREEKPVEVANGTV